MREWIWKKREEPLLYEISRPGRTAFTLPELDVEPTELPDEEFLRDDLPLPELSEVDVVRHYVHLSQLNYGVDLGFYPLGSCTMKYNPKVNEVAARLPGFTQVHPLQDPETVQGAMELMYYLQKYLAEITGFAATTLQPSAGAHGELTGVLMMRKYQLDRGETQRNKMLIPDSAHGTNPASSAMSGLIVVEIPSDERGNVDLEALKTELDDTVVGLMLTNPNTLGLFDEHLEELVEMVHGVGGLMYGDGANLNALMGITKPGELGFDVMHLNLHKTFSTPHGGGGPGSGPVVASEELAPFLPGPIVDQTDEGYVWKMPEKSIGRVRSFWGNFLVLVKAFTYISMLGPDGLRQASEHAVLNANYLQSKVKKVFPLPHDRICMHEFVVEGVLEDAPDVHALDVAKRLIDYGFHPPTNYFPLIVHEALMIEPTESESKETLDAFAEALERIAEEARTDPEILHSAPHNAPVRRLDEVKAARDLILRYEH